MEKLNKSQKGLLFLKRSTAFLAVAWTAFILLGMGWNIFESYQNTREYARVQALAAFEKDLVYRRWVAKHGGVYVPVTPETPPNPYLSHLSRRDVTTTTGLKLTLINPAYMTRQVHELGRKQYGHLGHITSSRPIRPENRADAWESKVLRMFEHGSKEFNEIIRIDNKDYLRLMRPMMVEKRCLKCHAEQGYQEGDLRGGISVSVPMEPLWTLMHGHLTGVVTGYLLVWLMGLCGIGFGALRTKQHLFMQVRAKEVLEESEKRYWELTKNMNNGVTVFEAVDDGQDFFFREHNPAGEYITGLSYDQVVGHRISEVFPVAEELGLLQVLQRVWKTGETEVLPAREYEDERFVLWVENSVFKLPGGEIVAVYRDITESKKLQEQLLIAEKMTTIAGLAAGVAHEINTPLSGILQATQLIEMGLDPDQEQNRQLAANSGADLIKLQDYLQKKELDFFLNGIKDSATTAARIVADLLQFSRPQESTPVKADLADLLDRSIELSLTDYNLKKEFNIANVEFVRQYSTELLHVQCLPMEIEQVVINLIKNACQAMGEEDGTGTPQIFVRTKKHGKMAVIEVEDNGPGMNKEIRAQIFDPFFTTKDVGQGTGLGLSVCYSIITEKHGGSIRVESAPEKGSRFVIELPMEETREEPRG